MGNDDIRSREQLVIDWQLPHVEQGFGDDGSADWHSTTEKELLNVWSGQSQQVEKGFELPTHQQQLQVFHIEFTDFFYESLQNCTVKV